MNQKYWNQQLRAELKDRKDLAEVEGIPYQTLVKSVLTKYIRKKKSA